MYVCIYLTLNLFVQQIGGVSCLQNRKKQAKCIYMRLHNKFFITYSHNYLHLASLNLNVFFYLITSTRI